MVGILAKSISTHAGAYMQELKVYLRVSKLGYRILELLFVAVYELVSTCFGLLEVSSQREERVD